MYTNFLFPYALTTSHITWHSEALTHIHKQCADRALYGIITTTISDPHAQFLLTKNIENIKASSSKCMHELRSQNKENSKEDLENVLWHNILNTENENVDYSVKTFLNIVNRSNNRSWYTYEKGFKQGSKTQYQTLDNKWYFVFNIRNIKKPTKKCVGQKIIKQKMRFFHKHWWFTGEQGKGETTSLTPRYHFHLLHRHLDISWVITAESLHCI